MSTSKKNNLTFILFITVSIGIFFTLKYEKDNRIEEFLSQKTSTQLQNYNVIYNHHKQISQLVFDTRINTEETKDILSLKDTLGKNITRDLLYTHLSKEYETLKQHNLKQLHFHLENNESFLRFHRPNKFRDNLTKIRETVNYVNSNKKPIDGFEEGRIYNGYRFVYPLSDKKKYLGSVEISFSTLAMVVDLMKNYDVTANFLISKKKVNEKLFESEKGNYSNSPFSEFYIEKKVFEYIQSIGHTPSKDAVGITTQKFTKFFNSEENTTSIFSPKLKKILTLIKVKNPITHEAIGIFVIRSDAQYIYNKTRNFYVGLF